VLGDADGFLAFRFLGVVEVGKGVDPVELAHEGIPGLVEAFDAFSVLLSVGVAAGAFGVAAGVFGVAGHDGASFLLWGLLASLSRR